jgi:hypothetical protein
MRVVIAVYKPKKLLTKTSHERPSLRAVIKIEKDLSNIERGM